MSDNKIMEQASNAIINGLRATIDELQKKVENLEQFDNELTDERLDEIIKLEGKVKQLRETNDELCFENDEINRKWAEDRERDGDILSEQQNQILALEEENEELKEENEDAGGVYSDFKNMKDERDGLKVRWEELEEENEKLKEQLNQINQN